MKIIQLTPGTGNFHCGSCLRDVALVTELKALGHEVILVPLYLPFVADEEAAEDTPIFFGGINVYLEQKFSLFRKTPRWLTGLLDHPAILRLTARGGHMTSARELGEMMISMLKGEEGRQAKELDHLMDWMRSEGPPDIVVLSNALLLGLANRIQTELGCPVVCTLQGEDSFIDTLPDDLAEQAWDLLIEKAAQVAALIPVSNWYGKEMQRRTGLPADLFHAVPNGVDFDDYAVRAKLPAPPVIGYLARLCEFKGLATLVDAYIWLRKKELCATVPRLHLAGAKTAMDEEFLEAQKEKLRSAGLFEDVKIETNISAERKHAFFAELSVFSVPATYGESFGLYVVEAMAAGIPVVQPRHAAFPEIIEATGGGLLCDADDTEDLARHLALLINDEDQNEALAARALNGSRAEFGVRRMAERILAIYHRVIE